jgi:hypothetical protein
VELVLVLGGSRRRGDAVGRFRGSWIVGMMRRCMALGSSLGILLGMIMRLGV